jgi:flavin-dependent dehydrogenase
MCAGIIPAGVLRELGELKLEIPPTLVMGEIDSYALHTVAGCLRVTMTDPQARAVAIFRGNGPGPGSPPEPISFDGFLLAEAERRGAQVIRQQVEEVCVRPSRWVRTRDGVYPSDLLVLASGVNGGPIQIRGWPYLPPLTETMAQAEVFVGNAEVQNRLGSAVHVFLPRSLPVVFATLVPKGPFVSVSLLGRGIEPRRPGSRECKWSSCGRKMRQSNDEGEAVIADCGLRMRNMTNPTSEIRHPKFLAL